MGIRDTRISWSILRALFNDNDHDNRGLLARILSFFALFQLVLARFCGTAFKRLRKDAWGLDEDEYRESFRMADKRGKLNSVGDLGYSGSTFFTTPNSKFLIKSLPRHFEHTFFTDDLFGPYVTYMEDHVSSLLVRITDFLEALGPTLGSAIGTAPAHHVVMENILYGKDVDLQKDKWETYDLKPASYFYPERDVAGGMLAPESVKERLVDKFPDKIRITCEMRDELLSLLNDDTALLSSANAVDYSLFLIRYPATPSRKTSSLRSRTSSWRTGVTSSDGQWIYRAVVLDFFWAKHKMQPKVMTSLIKLFNVFFKKGPMSITTNPEEYRMRFLEMVKGYIEVP
ncbi:uncharacterized protein K452DRAFT_362854 [Aplosporella prunicola CBS 121167]|uniref:PIPK domain-containing protein n=1 Tax=Aplosporella prunicola CBS 121167 TaxID=1176127 RepID=A0A6A6AVJ5_9PEZI|nr:uncharacterized protein K452DRAFT_362854 [Aplosporella prunicola CBS 121167]KAF2135959.1 hypothetical protein K452DRAFT_362854 [Aplosporella prunicola CBS 121167]